MVFYFLTCLQCSFQTTLTFQALIHFTDWVVGHAHMVMFGVFAMWQLGVMTYLIPRLLKTPWYSRAPAGVALLVVRRRHRGDGRRPDHPRRLPGTVLGFAHAWDTSIDISIPFWAVRLVAGLMMFTGFFVFVFNISATWVSSRAASRHRQELAAV